MARIRSIKPEFWTSEQVMSCSQISRLLFIGLWNFCDDHGRLPVALRQIKAQIFPGDDLTADAVRRMIDELSTNKLIILYTVDNKEYLLVTGWQHQKIDKRQNPKYPPPPDGHSSSVGRTVSTDRIGVEEGKGEDRKESENLTRSESDAARETDRTTEQRRASVLVCEAIVGAFEKAGSTTLPDLSHVDVWIAQGYKPEIIIAVVREGISRKPSIRSLKYFYQAIKEAHEQKPVNIGRRRDGPVWNYRRDEDPPAEWWRKCVREFVERRGWRGDGSEPGEHSCRVPDEILAEFGIARKPYDWESNGYNRAINSTAPSEATGALQSNPMCDGAMEPKRIGEALNQDTKTIIGIGGLLWTVPG